MDNKPTPVLPAPSEPFPGSKTPGWNDPPTLQCNNASSGGRPRLNLNKRVAFPMHGNTGLAKPTAIVQPNQATPSPFSSIPPVTQPIAVVHPMHTPMSNVNTSLSLSSCSTNTTTNSPRVSLSSTQISDVPQTAANTTFSSPMTSGQVPTMYVSAMPRNESNDTETHSTVQHI